MLYVIGIAVVILIIIGALYSKKKYEERMAALATWAAGRGFQFYPEGIAVSSGGLFASMQGDATFLSRFQEFSPFGMGDDWNVPMMISGQQDGTGWTIFDYRYDTESTSTDSEGHTTTSRTTHRYSVYAAEIPLFFPRIEIRPEGFLDRVGAAIGFKDLTFELDEFNRRYFVKAQDEKIAYGLICPQMIEYLMRVPPRHWQIIGNQIVIAEPSWQDVPEIDRVVTDMTDFIKLIPDYMRQDLGGGTT
jgi:hypothetical protein